MRELKGMFDLWKVDEDNGVIWDADGNDYDIHEIRALFYFRQWRAEFEGWNGRIYSLKEQLEKKLSQVKTPVVTVDWGDIQEKYIHPHYRK